MKTYANAESLLADMKTSFAADSGNPIATYALTYEGKPKQLVSKYTRCPKLKVPGVSETAPVWLGMVKLNGEELPLSAVVNELANLLKK
jgi:hypothetical protein